jgi:hypothetical protein
LELFLRKKKILVRQKENVNNPQAFTGVEGFQMGCQG